MDSQQPHGSTNRPVPRQCRATSKRSGKRCRKPAMRGRTVCLAHGGRTPRGVASPHFKTGRHSRSLPGRLVSAYEKSRSDPRLLSLREEIALVDAMICEVLEDLGTNPTDTQKRRGFRRIRALVNERRRLVESEVEHIVLARQTLTVDEAMSLMRSIAEVIKRHLPDPSVQASILEEIMGLIDSDRTRPIGTNIVQVHEN